MANKLDKASTSYYSSNPLPLIMLFLPVAALIGGMKTFRDFYSQSKKCTKSSFLWTALLQDILNISAINWAYKLLQEMIAYLVCRDVGMCKAPVEYLKHRMTHPFGVNL